MSANPDRLYQLMPVVYRLRDAERGYPLRGLLQVISEQVSLVDADIAQLYENWFIETCEDWVVPYIGALIGYTPIADTSGAPNLQSSRALSRERLLIPRAEVANTIRYRRRKGTLSLLEDLATAVAGWPAHAVEFYRLLDVDQNIDYLHLDRGATVDLRDGDALDQLGGPFDEIAHTVEVRRVNSHRGRGRFNIPEVGLFVWRLKAYSVTQAPAYLFEEESPNCFLFSVLGNDSQLYTNATRPTTSAGANATELNFPGPVSRRSLNAIETSEATETVTSGVPFYYGDGKSFEIWVGTGAARKAIPASQIIAADLTDWKYRPLPDTVAVDPKLGRIAFPPTQARKQSVRVSYYYGFSADIGGGEYDRPLSEPAGATLYLVGEAETFTHLADPLTQWRKDQPKDAVIEITDSGVYVEPINIALKKGQTLQIRAANRKRPVIRLLDWQTSDVNDLSVTGEADTHFTLDGLMVTGRGVHVEGDLTGLTIRHSTLVPGWGLNSDCSPKRPTEPSLELDNAPECVTIEHSILGRIQVSRDEVKEDPAIVRITDSIWDATSTSRVALGAPESLCAFTTLEIARTTVFGQVQSHAIKLAENNIFIGTVIACRRQQGCMRFCYVPPGSRTPRRYECQPDLVDQAVNALFQSGDITAAERDQMQSSERSRVEPEFNSMRYGTPDYCQLANACACEIKSGADDESEMGAFHDLYQPQRTANMKIRLNEYTPAGMDAGIIFAS
jgi:hypothetical protein